MLRLRLRLRLRRLRLEDLLERGQLRQAKRSQRGRHEVTEKRPGITIKRQETGTQSDHDLISELVLSTKVEQQLDQLRIKHTNVSFLLVWHCPARHISQQNALTGLKSWFLLDHARCS